MHYLSKKPFSVGTVRVLARNFDPGSFYSAFVYFRINNLPSSPYFYGLLSLREGDASTPDFPYYAKISVVTNDRERTALVGVGAGENIETAILNSFVFLTAKSEYLFCVEEEKNAVAQVVARIENALSVKNGDWRDKLRSRGIKIQRYFGKTNE